MKPKHIKKKITTMLITLIKAVILFFLGFLPKQVRWDFHQHVYSKWTGENLPQNYLDYIIKMGIEFAEFVGKPGRLLDIGCGNGMIGNMTYQKSCYTPIKMRDENDYVVGIDPLALNAPIPWARKVIQTTCEEITRLFSPGDFDKATIITTLDHLYDPEKCIKNCYILGIPEIFIWTTTFKKQHPGGDYNHLHRYTFHETLKLFSESGYNNTETKRVYHDQGGDGWFMKFRRKNQ